MATATLKSPAQRAETNPKQNHRIAHEATLATGCRFQVAFEPAQCLDAEKVLPARQRPSRGHLFSITFIPNGADPPALDVLLDDRDGNVFDLLAIHLRGLAEEFTELAIDVEAARRRCGAA